jgi:hypothetical protein
MVVDEKGGSLASLAAEYTLKQSKIHMSVDSNLLFKTTIDAQLDPSTSLQVSAEMQHIKEHYRFGYGIIFG